MNNKMIGAIIILSLISGGIIMFYANNKQRLITETIDLKDYDVIDMEKIIIKNTNLSTQPVNRIGTTAYINNSDYYLGINPENITLSLYNYPYSNEQCGEQEIEVIANRNPVKRDVNDTEAVFSLVSENPSVYNKLSLENIVPVTEYETVYVTNRISASNKNYVELRSENYWDDVYGTNTTYWVYTNLSSAHIVNYRVPYYGINLSDGYEKLLLTICSNEGLKDTYDVELDVLGVKNLLPAPSFSTTTQTDWNATGSIFINTTVNASGSLILAHDNASEIGDPSAIYWSNTSKLIAYWKFNNNTVDGENHTRIKDYSNYGTQVNLSAYHNKALNITGVEFGKIKGGLTLNGTGNSSAFGNTTGTKLNMSHYVNFTMMGWAKWVQASSNTQAGSIVAMGNGVRDLHQVRKQSNNAIRACVTTRTSSAIQCLTRTVTHTNNLWRHVVMTYNGSQILIYLDGTQLAGNLNVTGILNDSDNINIGQTQSGIFNNATIDEVAIWGNWSMDATAIANIYRVQSQNYTATGQYYSAIHDSTDTGTIWETMNTTHNATLSSTGQGINVRLRSCDDSSCSGELFVGVSNTTTSWFNLSNTITSTNYTLNTTIMPNNRYAQFLIMLNSTVNQNTTPRVQTMNISYRIPSGATSCTYSGSGNWNILCSDNCAITTDVTMPVGNNLSITGTGSLLVRANITTDYVDKVSGSSCPVYIQRGVGGINPRR